MKFWQRWFDRRSVTLQSPGWTDTFTPMGPTASSIEVTTENALQVPAVFACVQILAQDIARTPIKFRRRLDDETFVDATDHDLSEILGSLANSEQTSYQFKNT